MGQDPDQDESAKRKEETETLLKAIDAEIASITAKISATGRNRWGLTLSLAALVWAALQYWEAGGYPYPVLAPLALALYLFCDLISKVVSSLDKPFTSPSRRTGGFFDISQYLGAARTPILLDGILAGAAAWIAWNQASTPYKFLLGYTLGLTALSIGSFVTSYLRLNMSRMGIEEPTVSARVISAVIWILRVSAVVCSLHLFWKTPTLVNAQNLRFALILAAIPYLLTVLANDEFQLRLLEGILTIRHNLAFERITQEEARADLSLILAAEQLAQALKRPMDQLSGAIDKSRASISQLRATLDRLNVGDDTSDHQAPSSSLILEDSTLTTARKAAEEDFKNLTNYATNLKSHYSLLRFFAPNSAREAKNIIEKIAPVIEQLNKDLAAQKKRLRKPETTKSPNSKFGPDLLYKSEE